MKKIFNILGIGLLGLALVSCANDGKEEDITLTNEVSVITPYGTPYLAIGGLLEEEKINIEAVNGAANLQAALASGSHDIVLAPVNLGAKLYGGGKSQYKNAAVITMNNAYVVTKSVNPLESINDLVDQKVVGFGESGIPGSVLKTVYSSNSSLNVENISFTFDSSGAVYSAFVGDTLEEKYALMSEPEISKMVINDKVEVKTLDLCKVLDIDVPQACIYVNPNSQNQEDIAKVLELIEENVKELNENPTAYADKVIPLDRTFEAMGKEVIVRSVPLTNIVYKKAVENKNIIENILNVLGVKIPNDDFYYQG